MIMAAGVGSRLRPITDACPKALLPVLSVPCAQFIVDFCGHFGISELVFNSHHLAKDLEPGLRRLDFTGKSLRVSDESKQLLGSLGGVVTALPLLGDEPFLRVNADRILDFNLHPLIARHFELRAKHGVEMTLGLMTSQDPKVAYPEISMNGGLVEKLSAPKVKGAYFAGVAILEPSSLRAFSKGVPLDFVSEYLVPNIARKKVGGIFLDEGQRVGWMDIDSPELWRGSHFQLTDWILKGSASQWLVDRVMGRNFWATLELLAALDSKARPDFSALVAKHCYVGSPKFSFGSVGASKDVSPKSVIYDQFTLRA